MTCGDTWHLGISRATAHPTCGQFELGGFWTCHLTQQKYSLLPFTYTVATTEMIKALHPCATLNTVEY